ncbi:MAG: CapA family protein, partial [Lachnospiraceae bacterium]|nr:CapA family protein [Lachnospiraceae bacterium]
MNLKKRKPQRDTFLASKYTLLGGFLAFLLLICLPCKECFAKAVQEESQEITVIMVGDMLMHKKVVNTGLQKDGSYNFDHLFENVLSEVQGADLAIVNQETILGGSELGGYTGYPTFNSPYEVGDAEAKAGFDVVLFATNHALDRGAKGIENCLAFWRDYHPEIMITGIHDSEEDQNQIRVLEKNGIKIAILNYTYGTNGIQMPKGKPYLVDYLSEARIREEAAKAKEIADFVIVCPHWGTEYSH